MNAKSLAIAGALTLGLLAPAGTAIAATTNDHPSPLGGVLGIVGGHDRNGDNQDHDSNDQRFGRKHVSMFVLSSTIRSVNTDTRTITVGHAKRGGDTERIHVAKDAKIWRDGHEANLRDLKNGDHVRMAGEKKDGKRTATRVRAVS
jgi:Cu/Ag efflux protein CusF